MAPVVLAPSLFAWGGLSGLRDGWWPDWMAAAIAASLLALVGAAALLALARAVDAERQRADDGMRRLAPHDPVTGLPSRAVFLDRLDRALAHAGSARETLAVLVLRLERLDGLRSSLGAGAVDALLAALGERLVDAAKGDESAGRLGDADLGVALATVRDADDAARVAARFLDALEKPVEAGGAVTSVVARCGIALCHAGAIGADELLALASATAERAKAESRRVAVDARLSARAASG